MAKRIWNEKNLERRYQRILADAKFRGFTDEELASPYLDKLSKATKSERIYRMIELAYYLGQLRAVASVDDGYTPVVLSQTEIQTGF